MLKNFEIILMANFAEFAFLRVDSTWYVHFIVASKITPSTFIEGVLPNRSPPPNSTSSWKISSSLIIYSPAGTGQLVLVPLISLMHMLTHGTYSLHQTQFPRSLTIPRTTPNHPKRPHCTMPLHRVHFRGTQLLRLSDRLVKAQIFGHNIALKSSKMDLQSEISRWIVRRYKFVDQIG